MTETKLDFPSGSVPAPLHPREEERIARLLGYDILDTEPDIIFDRLTQMAATLTGSPISLISLVDRNRQWVKSHYGCDFKESPRDDAFCAYTILDPEKIMIVPDAEKDPRFQHNPLVTGDPHIRFYAGIPLHNGDGLPIGSFCVIDKKPRNLTTEQLSAIEELARIAMDYLEIHRSNRELTRLLMREKQVYNRLLSMSSELTSSTETLEEALRNIMAHLDPDLGWLSCRMTSLVDHEVSEARMNPLIPADPQIEQIWKEIDLHPKKAADQKEKTSFYSVENGGAKYAHLMIPVRNRGKLVAWIEMIYPDHRKLDPRIKEVFDIMASNLAFVAERELFNMELRRRAEHDALTGAVNRTLFIEGLQSAISESDVNHPDSALLFLDLDGFKEVNDNFGHQIGDRLLVEVTKRLRSHSRERDILGRLSGDEFVLLVRHLNLTNDLEPLLKRIQKTISQPFMIGGLEIRISCSIGAAILERNDISTPELLHRAEESMYLVKNGGRKGYCIADAKLIKEFRTRLDLDHKMHEAVFQKKLALHFQPIVDIRTGVLTSAEALLRVLDEKGHVMSAVDFIPSLERIRLMPDVDEWVFAEAIRLLRQHDTVFASIPGFSISLNVSPAILSTHGYASHSLERLKSAGISPTMVSLEIIENHLDTTNDSLLENINLFRGAGVKIAVDDFGTGYSNLKHLTSIPFDTIKIDRTFLKEISSSKLENRELLAAIINLGKNLGYSIIAEGIEDKEQVDHLLKLGCHCGQGYFYGKPMPIDEFIRYASTNYPGVLPLKGKQNIPPPPSLVQVQR
jgi:diguanylate cyclase (GGDEF)-like protein